MSYTYVHRVSTESRTGARDETVLVDGLHEGNELISATDGEELNAAAYIVGMLDELDNGEALVVRRVVF
jgi:hypothetical protein